MNSVIIGYGVVGNNIYNTIKGIGNVDVIDKYKKITCNNKHHNIGFICVDTPLINGKLSCEEVENAIYENECDIYVIKSTVPVGYTNEIQEQTKKRIVYSPEYYGATQHCNDFDFNFTVLGGRRHDCVVIQQMLQEVYNGTHKFYITEPKVAEIAKFMENAYLATKVSFCNAFFDICETSGVLYEDVREIFCEDPRINPSHTFIYRDHPYYDTHCLNKDVPSIANQFDVPLLKQIIELNNKRMKTY